MMQITDSRERAKRRSNKVDIAILFFGAAATMACFAAPLVGDFTDLYHDTAHYSLNESLRAFDSMSSTKPLRDEWIEKEVAIADQVIKPSVTERIFFVIGDWPWGGRKLLENAVDANIALVPASEGAPTAQMVVGQNAGCIRVDTNRPDSQNADVVKSLLHEWQAKGHAQGIYTVNINGKDTVQFTPQDKPALPCPAM